jgi:hypothetical protein
MSHNKLESRKKEPHNTGLVLPSPVAAQGVLRPPCLLSGLQHNPTLGSKKGSAMEPRLNIVTLGVRDLAKAVAFYRYGLGWPQSSASVGDFAIFKLSTGTALALYPRRLLAADAKVKDNGGFGGITLAQNVSDKKPLILCYRKP